MERTAFSIGSGTLRWRGWLSSRSESTIRNLALKTLVFPTKLTISHKVTKFAQFWARDFVGSRKNEELDVSTVVGPHSESLDLFFCTASVRSSKHSHSALPRTHFRVLWENIFWGVFPTKSQRHFRPIWDFVGNITLLCGKPRHPGPLQPVYCPCGVII